MENRMTYAPQQQYVESVDVPLWAPLYGASAPDAVIRFFRKYATFSGRASRSEYWWMILVNGVVSNLFYLLAVLAGVNDANVAAVIALGLLIVWTLATLDPGVALVVRRLHDANYSGWMALLGLIPLAGGIVLLVFVLMGPKPEGQQFDRPGSVQTQALFVN
jgi:uncharacterized membrane protein YhaH (DUF805 family)